MDKKRILIVDDDLTIQHLLKNILEKEGYATVIANNGQEGLDVLKEDPVDLVLLDILMPVMDGFTFFKEVKCDPATEHIPIFVLTIRKKMEDSFMALGADAFLGKPFNRVKLLTEIKMILQHEAVREKGEKQFKDKSPEQNEFLLKHGNETVKEPSSKGAEAGSSSGVDGEEIVLQKKKVEKILVAGTVDSVVNYMVENFKSQGYQVEAVNSGEELLRRAWKWKPDIILLEVNMDSTTVLEIINSLKNCSILRTQILLYSAFVTQESEKHSIVHAFYSKQFKQAQEEQGQDKQPVYYLGAFHRRSFLEKIKKFFSYSG